MHGHHRIADPLQRYGDSFSWPCPIHDGQDVTQLSVSLDKNCLFRHLGRWLECSGVRRPERGHRTSLYGVAVLRVVRFACTRHAPSRLLDEQELFCVQQGVDEGVQIRFREAGGFRGGGAAGENREKRGFARVFEMHRQSYERRGFDGRATGPMRDVPIARGVDDLSRLKNGKMLVIAAPEVVRSISGAPQLPRPRHGGPINGDPEIVEDGF